MPQWWINRSDLFGRFCFLLDCSVATTSTKPPAVIKADIRRVLERMQVQYREIRGGFECLHMPSIDLASVIADAQAHQQQTSTHDSGSKRIARKASKLSFGPKKKEKDTGSVREEEKQLPTRPTVTRMESEQSEPGNNVTSVSGGSSSFFNIIPSQELPGGGDQQQQQQQPADPTEPLAVKANGSTHSLEALPEEAVPQEQDPNLLSPSQSALAGSNSTTPRPVSPTRNKFLPPIPRDFAAQHQPKQEQEKNQGTTMSKPPGALTPSAPRTPTPTPGPGGSITIDDLFEMSSGSELVVRFEINILKVPLLPLHGIQFRRVGGDGWQYQMLARRVLTELKL
jgi:serine/threonine protein kinase KIN1/2